MRVDGTVVTQFMEFDAPSGVWKFNALKAGMKLQPGAKVKVEVRGLADKYGNVQRAPYVFSFDCVPPPGNAGPDMANVTVHSGTELISYSRQYEMELSFGLSFEEYFGHVHAIRDCKMEWLNDPALAAEGNRAVRFTCLQDDGDPQVLLHKNPWFIDRLPMLSFDYKADPGFKVDLQVEAFGVWYSIRFLGAGHDPDEGKNVGAIPGIVADGTWRHASVDLRMLLDNAKVRLPDRIINKIVLSANGEDGCVRGATLCIDNWDMAPANGIPWRGNNASLKWSAKKTPGEIGGYSLVVDQDATTIAPKEINQNVESIGLRARSGVWYMHVRACDQAGNWGADKTIRHDFGRNSPRQSNREFDDN